MKTSFGNSFKRSDENDPIYIYMCVCVCKYLCMYVYTCTYIREG